MFSLKVDKEIDICTKKKRNTVIGKKPINSVLSQIDIYVTIKESYMLFMQLVNHIICKSFQFVIYKVNSINPQLSC
jgi:hypothetical protein